MATVPPTGNGTTTAVSEGAVTTSVTAGVMSASGEGVPPAAAAPVGGGASSGAGAPLLGAGDGEEPPKRKTTSFKITNVFQSRPPSNDPDDSGEDGDDVDDSHTEVELLSVSLVQKKYVLSQRGGLILRLLLFLPWPFSGPYSFSEISLVTFMSHIEQYFGSEIWSGNVVIARCW